MIWKKDKKGSVADVLVWIVVAFITVLFLGGWLYAHNLLTDQLLASSDPGLVQAATDIAVPVNEALITWTKVIAFSIIFAMGLSILISNFLVRAHPVFFVVHLLVTMGAIAVSASLSNRYVELLQDSILADTLSTFTAVNFIMQFLPYFAAVIGIFGAIFLFIGIQRDKDMGAGI